MFLSMVVKDIKIYWEIKKCTFLSELEFRSSFLIQVFGMVFNNSIWIIMWILFFDRFQTLNHWKIEDTFILFAMSTLSFGIAIFLATGVTDLSKKIAQGELDHFLTYPISPLVYISANKSRVNALGDIITGLVLIFFVKEITAYQVGLFFITSILAAIILYSCALLYNSIAFFTGDFQQSANQLFDLSVALGMYPQNIYVGALKVLSMTFVPGFFMYALPVEIINNFNWKDVIMLSVFTVGSFTLARLVFNLGLQRYESGNLFTIKE
jgi:ABC-2 type transport system permease protein